MKKYLALALMMAPMVYALTEDPPTSGNILEPTSKDKGRLPFGKKRFGLKNTAKRSADFKIIPRERKSQQ
jgi:hypothetical protein